MTQNSFWRDSPPANPNPLFTDWSIKVYPVTLKVHSPKTSHCQGHIWLNISSRICRGTVRGDWTKSLGGNSQVRGTFILLPALLADAISLRLILTQCKMKNVPWSPVTFILLSVNVVTALYELYIIPKEFTCRIPEEDRNGQDAAQPSTGPSFHDDAIPVIASVIHPLRGLMNSLRSHNQLLCSRDLK